MKELTTRAALGVLTVGIAAGLGFFAFILATPPQRTAQAEPGVSIGFDADPYNTPANSATSLGTIEGCIQVANGAQFDIDLYVKDVPESLGLLSFDIILSYDPTVLKVVAKNVSPFLAAGYGSNVFDTSGSVEDTSGYYPAGALDMGSNHDWGEGVLARLTLEAVGNGLSHADLMLVTLNDSDGDRIGPTDQYGYFAGPTANGAIAVGEPCPDTDGDGVFDPVDNCPNTYNPGQEDGDGDGVGDACDDCLNTAPGAPVDANGCAESQVDQDLDGMCDPGASSPLWCTGSDNCPTIANADQADGDGDEVGDACDNCPFTSNPDQADMDGDGLVDTDGDTLFDEDQLGDHFHRTDDDGDTLWDEDGGGGDACDTDADGDGYLIWAEEYYGSDPADPGSTPEVCDGADNDGDTEVDEGYDYNGNTIPDCTDPNADTDGDTVANPDDEDDDNDGWPDSWENLMATDSLDACPDDANDPAWAADMDNSQRITIGDVIMYRFVMGGDLGEWNYDRRFDLDANTHITIGDVLYYRLWMGQTCT